MHDRMGAEFPQVLVQVVDERVVVVDDQNVQRNPPTNMRSRITIAATFSTTGTARGTMQGSWRPVTRKVTGIPFVIPPRMPPARFVAVTTRPPSIVNGSLCWLPRIVAPRNPAPKSTPFTAGIENSR